MCLFTDEAALTGMSHCDISRLQSVFLASDFLVAVF